MPHRIALKGRVVTMNAADEVVEEGVLYVEDETIVDVRPASAPAPDGFNDVHPAAVRGTIYPGMIELHNHLPYNVLTLWQVPRLFTNRGQWGGTPEYRKLVTGPMSVLGRFPGLLPAVVRFVECKCLVSGVTTSQGIALFSNAGARRFYRGIVRNVESTNRDELPNASTRIADIDAEDAERFLERLEAADTLLLHLAEGIDDTARKHFLALRLAANRWALGPALAGIHAAGLSDEDMEVMAEHGASVVWSPLSNLLLYGGTTRVDAAAEHGVLVGLGSDWSVSGSKNLLGELKVARLVSAELGGVFSDLELTAMATRDAAAILKWDALLGSLEAGKLADLFVVRGDDRDPYAALLDARETDISLVMIGGVARYGTPALVQRLGEADGILDEGEPVRVGGLDRVLRLTDPQADPDVAAISLAGAKDKLADALDRLPELARALEDGTAVPEFAPPRALAPGQPTWFLALDELADTGMALRPHLRGPDDRRTGPEPEGFLRAAEISEIVEPLELDGLTVADDREFFDRIEAQFNLPDFVRTELRAQYAGAD